MDLKQVIIFFTFILATHCFVSDNIKKTFNDTCQQKELALRPLNIEICQTSGKRDINDLVCNTLSEVMPVICNNELSISYDKVINGSKFDNSVENFCNEAAKLSIPDDTSKFYGQFLNTLKNTTTCPFICSYVGKVQPQCAFLYSYYILSTPVKKEYVVKPSDKVPNPPLQIPEAPLDVSDKNKIDSPSGISHSEITKEELPNKISPNSSSTMNNEPKPEVKSIPNDVPLGPSKIDVDTKPHLPNNADSEIDQEQYLPPESNAENIDEEKTPKEGDSPPPDDRPKEEQNEKLPISDDLGKPMIQKEPFTEAESSNFFAYFMLISALFIFFYIAMYNKKKILALMIEGRRSNVKRRPNSAAYSKLDCNLEEAMASGPSTSSSNTLLY